MSAGPRATHRREGPVVVGWRRPIPVLVVSLVLATVVAVIVLALVR